MDDLTTSKNSFKKYFRVKLVKEDSVYDKYVIGATWAAATFVILRVFGNIHRERYLPKGAITTS